MTVVSFIDMVAVKGYNLCLDSGRPLTPSPLAEACLNGRRCLMAVTGLFSSFTSHERYTMLSKTLSKFIAFSIDGD